MNSENIFETKCIEESKDTIKLRKLIAFIQSLVVIFTISGVIDIEVVQLDGYTTRGYEIVVSNYHLFLFYSVLSSYITILLLRIVSFVFSEEDNNFYPSLVTMQTFNTFFCVAIIGALFLMILSFSKGVIPFNIYDKWFITSIFFGFHLLGYYYINYYFSRSLIKLPLTKSILDKKLVKSRIKLIIRQPSFHFISIPIWFIVFFQMLYLTSNIFAYISDYNNKPAEYFNTPFKRQAWWHSQDSEWKEVFRTVHFEDYLYTDSWPLSEIKYYLGIPYFPDDEYISHFFKVKCLNCERYYSEKAYQAPKRMSKYLTNLSGMSSLTNITSLYLGNSRIVNFKNLEKLKKLKTLWIENTNLKNLDLLEFVNNNLTDLRLDYNYLKRLIGIDKLKNLKKLNCSNNKIESLEELSELSKLEFLDCNSNNIKSVNGLQELTNLKTLIIYDNPVVDSVCLRNFKVKNLITTQKEFFEWQGNGHNLCEDILTYHTGFYLKKYGYLTYSVDSLLFGDTSKLVLEFTDSTIVVKMNNGYNKFAYKLIIENDSITYVYDLIEKFRTEDEK